MQFMPDILSSLIYAKVNESFPAGLSDYVKYLCYSYTMFVRLYGEIIYALSRLDYLT